ncbi:sigma-70 family RNA polymerase sigma factor [Actinospica durhamensis]|uniref:sigma-70 family RNA polymerase sigma factor n=1 Tax=Actinospica durhamensis TaxID=1508375 RepID=UPI0027DB571A|nr:sigma-70 family RNA polymerase sigma factor [Actinospica durhamensis]
MQHSEKASTRGRSPEELLRQTARGDASAFEALTRYFAPLVFGVALRVCEDRSLAEEVAQEAFLDIWRTAARYERDRGSAHAWIVTITHRRAVDQVRSERAHARRELHAKALLPMVDFDQVAEAVDEAGDRERLRTCLGVLSRLQRESIHLAFFDGLTHTQISVKLQVPLGTAKARLREGLGNLKSCMGVGEKAGGRA